MSTPGASGPDAPVVLARHRTVDAVVAAIIFLVGAVVAFDAWRLGARWTDDGPGSGYFPFYIGLIVCGSALCIFWQAAAGRTPDQRAFVDREQLGRVLSVLLPAIGLVAGISVIGIYLASALYIASFMAILGRYGAVRSIAVGVAVAAFFFLMFEVWFKVPLYKGSYDPLWFLGY